MSARTKKVTPRRRGAPAVRMTLAQVARQSGVAVSTVSHILNDRPSCYASQETRDRVINAARELGYRPNLAARALRGGKTFTLGVITTALDVEVSVMRCSWFEQAARDNGYLTILSFNPNDAASEDRLILWLRDRSVDAIALHPSELGDHIELRALVDEGFPVMTFDGRELVDFPVDDVSVDYALGGQLQARHLLEIGRKRVCIAEGVRSCNVVDQRVNPMIETLRAGGAEPYRLKLDAGNEQRSSRQAILTYQQMLAFLRENHTRFDAVAAVGDMYGLAALRAASELGLRVPQDLAVIGFDGMIAAESNTIPMTTIEHPEQAAGELGFAVLAERLDGVRKKVRQERVPPKLVVRASTVGM